MKCKCLTKKAAAALLAFGTAIALSACGNGSDSSSRSDVGSANTNAVATESALSGEKLLSSMSKSLIIPPNLDNATNITLAKTKATVSGSGVSQKNGVVTIQKAGTYVIKGTLKGRIVVNAPNASVTIVLSGATVNADDSAALYVAKAKKVTLYMTKGTNNGFSDGKAYSFNDELSSKEDDEPNACIYSKSDLLLAGEGSLSVVGNYNNGIRSNDTLRIESANLTVKSAKHGISAKDYFESFKSTITVTSGGDAIRATKSKSASLGYAIFSGTKLTADSGNDGVQAETVLAVETSTVNVKSGGGSNETVSSKASQSGQISQGNQNIQSGQGSQIVQSNQNSQNKTDSESMKGLKAGNEVYLASGNYTLDCSDDAIHSNSTATIKGGNYNISTGDDGVHADSVTTVAGGTVTVKKCYEGLEGATVNITGGTVDITADDDGINAAGGNDDSGKNGGDSFSKSNDYAINISGGKIKVSASGDGVDSNGNINVSGGETYIDGPVSGGDSALDYDGTAKITGGTFIATGSSGMAQNFGTESTQGSILLTDSANSNKSVSIKNSVGKTLCGFTPKKQYTCVVISSSGMKKGESYTVNAFGKETKVTLSELIYGSGRTNSENLGNQHGNGQQDKGNAPEQNGGGSLRLDGSDSEKSGIGTDNQNSNSSGGETADNSGDKTKPYGFKGRTKPQGDPPAKPDINGTVSQKSTSSESTDKSSLSNEKSTSKSSDSVSSKKSKSSKKSTSSKTTSSSKKATSSQKASSTANA